ncbi:phosphoglycerate kinase, partial [Patescibacteria group bacterium]|nr:phosphoglycerate kinase [Patescibacteria group bacterium]
KVILMSHLGKPLENQRFIPSGAEGVNSKNQKEKFSLSPIAKRLSELSGAQVFFVADCVGSEVERRVSELKPGEVLLLENLRFHKEEELNDEAFAQNLARLAEIYVNDAFGTCHRSHASVVAVTKFLPSYAGLLLQKEVENLSRARDNPDHPLTVVIGGAKMSTKIKLIQSFFDKAENIILGGALANTVLHAKGIAVGKSIIEESMVPEIQKFEITSTKVHLPLDALLCTDKDDLATCHPGPIGLMQPEDSILDIGLDTEKLFARVMEFSKMVVWNGPMGLFEIDAFAHGSKAIARAIARSGAYSIVGGGETVAFLEKAGLIDSFSFVSTGGGAMMEFLAGDKLPGLTALE